MGKFVAGGFASYSVLSCSPYSVHQVVGRSMQPTLNSHLPSGNQNYTINRSNFFKFQNRVKQLFEPFDWVLVKSSDRYNLKAGDIVTMHNPRVHTDRDIKRVVATGAQAVVTRGYKNRTVVIPEGYIWVEGDNHSLSKDSNTYGPVPAALVFGKAVAIVFPPWRWRRLLSEAPTGRRLQARGRDDSS